MPEISGGLVLVAAGMTAAGVIVRYVVRGVRSVVLWGRRVEALAQVADVELRENHGSSIKDAVNRIEETQAEHGKALTALTERFDEHLGEQ